MAKSDAILTRVYKTVTSQLDQNGYNRHMSKFFEDRSNELYDTCPCDRIFFTDTDYLTYFNDSKINEADVKIGMSYTYYANMSAFYPRAAKDPLTVAQMCVIRHQIVKHGIDSKEVELASLFLSFSGKFYPSIHYMSYPKTPPTQYRHVMEYVINNDLNEKYFIKTEGSVIGAIRIIVKNWLDSYKKEFQSFDDTRVVYLIQQLHVRIKSFTINIAKKYYEAYDNKDRYMAYAQDAPGDEDGNGAVMVDNDALLAERIVQKTMEKINIKGVDYKICKEASDDNVRTNELKSILEGIISDQDNQPLIKEFIGILVALYFRSFESKNINDITFILFSIRGKSNSKDPDYLRSKEIVENWLDENSPQYRKRSKRLQTKQSYHRSIYAYFALATYYANK